ncbi:hypothetical protein FIBSPDRAFT_253979 [Athelia psychrophila]|uniref:Uncharacterized protein n=1 Tax=Athelia psychrophila TaxID=1759441 RepID=A0A165XMN3_9AGAM|nr:hypothetical protein FIBSPDRAFT_354325 [Fibularhizoctonia sp. CBS 109695]KZP08706.1 hypothetical protein FIBSPDRAFT_253979 [Fibularhizoctonia sp. CBS 109695]
MFPTYETRILSPTVPSCLSAYACLRHGPYPRSSLATPPPTLHFPPEFHSTAPRQIQTHAVNSSISYPLRRAANAQPFRLSAKHRCRIHLQFNTFALVVFPPPRSQVPSMVLIAVRIPRTHPQQFSTPVRCSHPPNLHPRSTRSC